MSAKERLQLLSNTLSEYECEHLLRAVGEVATGERFWETDIGLLYNEYVKARYFNIARNLSNLIPASPAQDDGLFAPLPLSKHYPNATMVDLPPPRTLSGALGETLAQRRSRRDYRSVNMSIETLSDLLHHACGVTARVSGYDYNLLPLRSFPTSGGLQTPEIYVSVQSVDGLQPGLYHYNVRTHRLELLKPGNHGRTLRGLALDQSFVENACVTLLLTGFYERLRWKYGERGYRYMCMDMGFLGQNLYLVAEALGLGACAIAGFVDDAAEEVLDVNGRDEIILLLMTVGVPVELSGEEETAAPPGGA
jgi:SagB-type dehydrogenase family enzyme